MLFPFAYIFIEIGKHQTASKKYLVICIGTKCIFMKNEMPTRIYTYTLDNIHINI